MKRKMCRALSWLLGNSCWNLRISVSDQTIPLECFFHACEEGNEKLSVTTYTALNKGREGKLWSTNIRRRLDPIRINTPNPEEMSVNIHLYYSILYVLNWSTWVLMRWATHACLFACKKGFPFFPESANSKLKNHMDDAEESQSKCREYTPHCSRGLWKGNTFDSMCLFSFLVLGSAQNKYFWEGGWKTNKQNNKKEEKFALLSGSVI